MSQESNENKPILPSDMMAELNAAAEKSLKNNDKEKKQKINPDKKPGSELRDALEGAEAHFDEIKGEKNFENKGVSIENEPKQLEYKTESTNGDESIEDVSDADYLMAKRNKLEKMEGKLSDEDKAIYDFKLIPLYENSDGRNVDKNVKEVERLIDEHPQLAEVSGFKLATYILEINRAGHYSEIEKSRKITVLRKFESLFADGDQE